MTDFGFGVLNWFLNFLDCIRVQIFGFTIPFLGISYFEFCIYLAISGMVMKVLLNCVNVSAGEASGSFARKRKRKNKG